MSLTKNALIIVVLIFAAAGCSREPQDLTIPMKPGAYEVSVKKVSGGITDPKNRTKTRCYPETVFDPFNLYHKNKDCKISNVVRDSNMVSFDFDCDKGANINAKGKIEHSVDGETIRWQSTLTSIDGNDIDIITSGTGKYVGKCK